MFFERVSGLLFKHLAIQGFNNVNVLFAVVFHFLRPLGPIGVLTKLTLVVTEAIAPSFKAVASKKFHRHSDRALAIVNGQDVWVEHPTKNQRVEDLRRWFKEWIDFLQRWHVKADHVVTDKEVSLCKHVDTSSHRLVSTTVVVPKNFSGI